MLLGEHRLFFYQVGPGSFRFDYGLCMERFERFGVIGFSEHGFPLCFWLTEGYGSRSRVLKCIFLD